MFANFPAIYTPPYGENMYRGDDIPLLYHYARPNGFEGMLAGKSLWFSNIHDQNDTEEYRHALQLISDVVEQEYEGLSGITLDLDVRYPVYTCSLTTAKDTLSQWRGYCPGSEGGYCYSIKREQLQAMIIKQKLMLAKCIYDEGEKIKFIKDVIIGVSPDHYAAAKRGEFRDTITNSPDNFMFGKRMEIIRRRVANYAPIMKHEAFAEEHEWRIVTFSIHDGMVAGPYNYKNLFNFKSISAVKNRYNSGRNIEYLEMPLTNDLFDEVLLDIVIISPIEDKEAAKIKCQQLVCGHGETTVLNSKIPYRNW